MSWTDYDENTWEFAAGKVLKNYQCDGPYRAVKPTYEELFETDQFDAMARKAMGELNLGQSTWTLDQQIDLLASKQHDYGHGNINKFGPFGVRVRLWDKIARYKNLGSRRETAKNESYEDTLKDVVGYCVVYGMVKNGTFEPAVIGRSMRIDDRGVTLHQSDIKSHCLEQMRLRLIAEGPRVETDAATVGTVLHSLIEHEITVAVIDSEADAVAWAAAEYVNVLEQYKSQGSLYSMGTFDTHDRALKALSWLVRSWFHCPERVELCYSGQLEFKSEWSFDLKFTDVPVGKGKKKELIPVYLAGQADLVCGGRVYDWKTAGSEYKQWEYQRWGRQPDVYTWAAAQEGLIKPDRDGLYYFDFKVFVRRQEIRLPDTVTVKRGPNHWAWLEVLVHRVVTMQWALGLDQGWPLDDQHVLCSDRWCPFWDQCKGQLIDPTKGWT